MLKPILALTFCFVRKALGKYELKIGVILPREFLQTMKVIDFSVPNGEER